MKSLPRTGHSVSLLIQCACTALVALGASYLIPARPRIRAAVRHRRTGDCRYRRTLETALRARWSTVSRLARPCPRGTGPSMTANIATSPPPALLLAVELLNRAAKRHRTEPGLAEVFDRGEVVTRRTRGLVLRAVPGLGPTTVPASIAVCGWAALPGRQVGGRHGAADCWTRSPGERCEFLRCRPWPGGDASIAGSPGWRYRRVRPCLA